MSSNIQNIAKSNKGPDLLFLFLSFLVRQERQVGTDAAYMII